VTKWLIIDAQFYRCEPFNGSLRPKLYYAVVIDIKRDFFQAKTAVRQTKGVSQCDAPHVVGRIQHSARTTLKEKGMRSSEIIYKVWPIRFELHERKSTPLLATLRTTPLPLPLPIPPLHPQKTETRPKKRREGQRKLIRLV